MPRAPRRSAVALRYQPEAPFLDAAPKLVAKGQGLLAERMLDLAREHNIPVQSDPDLLHAMEPLDVGQVIPPQLFRAVAIMLAGLYRANAGAPRKSS